MAQKKIYAAERQFLKQQGKLSNNNGFHSPDSAVVQTDQSAVLEAIAALKQEMQTIKKACLGEDVDKVESAELVDAMQNVKDAKDELDSYKNEINLLKNELRGLSHAIQETKREIAALSPTMDEDDGLNAVTHELDAIVSSTESATSDILDIAEHVETTATAMRSQNKDNFITTQADDILESITHIYEACNFQDLTGQRITKAVNALKYVEEKIERMMEIWGREDIAELADKTKKERTDDSRLLNGPALEEKAIGQDDIDRLFDM